MNILSLWRMRKKAWKLFWRVLLGISLGPFSILSHTYKSVTRYYTARVAKLIEIYFLESFVSVQQERLEVQSFCWIEKKVILISKIVFNLGFFLDLQLIMPLCLWEEGSHGRQQEPQCFGCMFLTCGCHWLSSQPGGMSSEMGRLLTEQG